MAFSLAIVLAAGAVVASMAGFSSPTSPTSPSSSSSSASTSAHTAGGEVGNPSPAAVYVEPHCTMTAVNGLTLLGGSATTNAQPIALAEAGVRSRRGGGAVPPSFTAESVMNCGTQDENVPGSGTWRVATQGSSAPGDLVALLGAYALPSGNNVGRSCTGELDFDPYVVLIDGKGDAIWPAAPRDGCGRVRAEVTAAIAATHWTVTESKRAVLEAPASTPPAGSVKP